NSTITGGTATLTTTGAGAVTTGGKGSVNTTNFNLNTGTALSTVTTNTANLIVSTAGGGVNLTQGVNAINISGKLGGAGNLTVKSAGQVTFNAPTFLAGNTLAVTTTGKAGIKINAPIFLGAGTANLTTDQGVILESVGNVLTATNVTLTSNVSIGSKTAPFLTNASNLTVNDIGAKSVAYVTDQNIGTLTFNGDGGATPGSLFLTSSANQLLVGSANYANVSLTDSVANGKGIDFNIGVGKLGTGAAKTTFTVNSGSFITDSSGATLNGATITLTGTKGVGTKAQPIIVNSPNLVLNSSQGDVWVVDGVATTVNGSAWLKGTFSVVDKAPSGVGITVGKAIGGGNIILSTGGFGGSIALTGTTGTATTSSLTLDSATTVTTKGAINAAGITFQAVGPVTIGGPVGSPTTDINFKVTGPGGIAVNGAISGNNIGIDSAGPVTITKAITGSGAGSSVNITGAASTPTGNAVVIGAAITGETISVGLKTGAQGNIAVNAAVGNANTVSANISAVSTALGGLGSITGTGLVTGTTVSLGASNSVGTAAKLFNTAAGTLNVTSGPGGTDGAFVQQKGNLVLGSSTDSNFVLKVTGNLDVAGVVTSPSININATGTTTIDGTIQNTSGKGPTSGVISITSGGPLTITGTGKLITTNDTKPVTVNVKGLTTVNGLLSVDTLNLTSPSGLTVGPTGVMADGVDNFTTTGPIDVEGQLGKLDNSTVFNITTTGTFTIGGSAVVNGGGLIQGGQIANYGVFTGAVKMIGTGAGNAFSNFNTITGGNITITTTNPAGVIFNAPGAIIQAVAPNSTSPSPTLNLNTYGVNNQGTISAVGTFQGAQGILNITSPGALTISGVDGGFKMGAYSAVNLKAAGNVTVGGIVGGVNSNPFSNFNAANELGQFTLNTTGNFSSTMPGVSVLTNNTGSFGGVINLQAANVLYNGVGTAPVFALNAIGAGLGVSGGKSPVTLTLTGAQGITIGNAPGNFSVNVEGFDNTSKSTFSTTGALKIDTSAFNVHYTSLLLSGITGVLITGDLNEGTKAGTNITINTTSTTPFLIGGATTNGMTGLSVGQGLTADTLTLNTPGGITLGTKAQGQIIVAPSGVTLNGQNLAVNQGSDIVSKAVTVNVPSGNTTYTNLNTDGGISASALTINDNGGIVTLVSGSTASTAKTQFTLGPLADGTNAHITGGVFTINAQSLSFQKNLDFEAFSPVNGGGVHINLSTPVNITVGSGNGQISANVSSGVNYDNPIGSGKFDISTGGNIVADLSAVTFGKGGDLSLSAGGTLKVSNVYNVGLNLYNFNSSSTSPFLMAGATTNGITDAAPNFIGGRIQAATVGPLVTNGANINGVAVNLTSIDSLDISKNTTFFVNDSKGSDGKIHPGELTFTAPTIITNSSTFTYIAVAGGSSAGGTITINTSTTPITIGGGKGQFVLDVGTGMVLGDDARYHAGSITVSSPGALAADLSATIYTDLSNNVGIGGSLILQSGFASNLSLSNVNQLAGFQFSTATFTTGSTTAPFLMTGAAAGGNGFVGSGGSTILTAGSIVVLSSNNNIDATGYNSVTSSLVLNANAISFGPNQVITVQPESSTIGLNPVSPSNNGGNISLVATTFNFDKAGGVTLQAKGDGVTAGKLGGTIVISSSGASVAVSKIAFNLDVSNGGAEKAGEVDINTSGDVSIDAKSLTYGSTGGILSVNAPNIVVSNTGSLNQGSGFGLDKIALTSNSTNDFLFGSATSNGFVETGVTLKAKDVEIANLGGNINTTGGTQITGNTLALNASGQITFKAGDTITALQDLTTAAGGTIAITAGSVAYDKVGAAVTFVAKSNGAAATAGSVVVNVTGSNALTIGAGGMAFDVSNSGGGSAGSVTVNNGGDVGVDASAINFGNTKNGSLSLGATGNLLVTNAGTLKTGSGLGLDKIAFTSASNNDFQFGGAPVGGNGLVGAPTLQATEIDIVNNGISGVGGINTNGGTLSAHTLLLSTPNGVTLAPAGLKVLEDPTTHDGGSMTINAGSLAGASGVTLSAKGTTGAGGNITLAITSTNPLVVGAGGLTLDVSTAGTTGGNVSITNAGDISVDGSAISYGKSGGGLTLTGNNLLITKVASLSTFPLKTIALTSLSSSDFVFGGATTNGFGDVGAQTLKADSVSISVNVLGNLTGGIDTTGATTVSTHTLVLSTLNTVTLKSGGTIAAVADATSGDGGSITINAGSLVINGAGGSTLTANATTGKGGSILVNVGTTSDLIIGSGGLNFSVTNAATFNGGSVTVNNGGGIIADASKINLGSNFGANPGPKLILNANGILAVSNLLATAALGLDTLTLTSDSAQTFSLGGAALGTNGVNDALPDYKAANITIANAGGAIINGGSKGLNGATSLTLNASTDIGALGTPIVITGSGGGAINAGGNAYLKTTGSAKISSGAAMGEFSVVGTAGDLIVGGGGTVSAAQIDISYTAPANANTLTLGSLEAFNGNLNVQSSAKNLVVTDSAIITSENGDITLANTGVSGGANIAIGNGVFIHGTGPLTNGPFGNIFIYTGAAPTGTVPGTAPANADVYSYPGNGLVTFGAAGNINGTITVAKPAKSTDFNTVLAGLARVLVFNEGAGAITVGFNGRIIADPPGLLPVFGSSTTAVSSGPVSASSAPVSVQAVPVATGAVTAPTTPVASTTPVNAVSAPTVSAPAIGSISAPTITSNVTAAPSVVAASAAVAGITSAGMTGLLSGLSNSATASYAGGGYTLNGEVSRDVKRTGAGYGSVGGASNTAHRSMVHGAQLLAPLENTVVETPFGSVSVAAQSVAMI
ncbi:MAG: hypothetical protein JSS86_06545, partial [Cyanobacteria bacterium SZAS LIN-2]|nr:hypothetical protein [Cyanobacteria bacterium SZAS LIN-2]